jgi:hypothetical protein
MRWGVLSVALGCALVFLAVPALARAAAPPDRNDPCASVGRDSCGSAGVGFYRSQRYGVRWFGDYRGVVPGEAHTFCIDLRFWYASVSYRYREAPARGLLNKDGAAVSVERQRRMAYALWEYGRSASPSRQAAVMLYVHALMGDARPGELDPAGLGPRVASTYKAIAIAARRYHGPYRIQTRLSGKLRVGQRARATIRLLSAAGHAVTNTRLRLSARGARGLPQQVETGDHGFATIAFTPTAASLSLRVASGAVASSSPRIFVPTSSAAAANGQRLAAPAFERISATVPLLARPAVSTRVSARIVRPGSQVFDRIRVQGLGGRAAQVEVELFGPFSSRAKISCQGRRYWSGRIDVRGASVVRSPQVTVTRAGFYSYRERVVGGPSLPTASTDCALASETVLASPSIVAGRGDTYAVARTESAGDLVPARVSIPSLGIRARVKPAAIDVRRGVLAIPLDIRLAGWWQDGTRPGAKSGAVLIAGHVDSARGGAGAFFKLHSVRIGERVQLATAGGRTYSYRVVSVRSYTKSALPTGIYSGEGAPRLVLVTCGGPFDAATGHYEDNVVVTAVPA